MSILPQNRLRRIAAAPPLALRKTRSKSSRMSTATDTKQAAEVFYDGACPICSREIAVYRKMDGLETAAWTDVSQPGAAPEGVTQAEALARFHIRRQDGEIVSGARAFLAIWRRSPRLRWLAVALDRRPLVDALELAYCGFLKLRPLWRRT